MIQRKLEEKILEHIEKDNKAIIILGARQVGKSTLIKHIFGNKQNVMWLNGDEIDVQSMFSEISSTRLKAILADSRYVVIDEAQRIDNIGLKLKLITDSIPNVKVIATGSSAFELANKINEPLTGRKWEYKLFPLSFGEMVKHHGLLEELRMLPHRLVYGYYPEIVVRQAEEKNLLKQLTDSYLYKDILVWENIKKPDKLLKLLQALAFQVGNQVSYNELGQICELDNKTIEKYILLLEQIQIIFRLNSFSRNLRNELKNSRKIYFYDNGIRNALTSNFNQIELRDDIGKLWENYLMSERIKYTHYSDLWTNRWFWRSKQQQEIDLIEEYDGHLFAYEFKWNVQKKVNQPITFKKEYPNHSFFVISRDNYDSFLLGKLTLEENK